MKNETIYQVTYIDSEGKRCWAYPYSTEQEAMEHAEWIEDGHMGSASQVKVEKMGDS